MKILLIDIHKSEEVWNSLGVGYLASVIEKAGYEVHVELLHFGSNISEFISVVKEKNYDIIGFSSSFYNSFDFALNLITLLKKEGIKAHIILGGHTPTSCYKNVMRYFPEIDSIARGEGENIILELVASLNEPEKWGNIKGLVFRRGDDIIENPQGPLISDLDTIPYPLRKQFIHKKIEYPISVFNSTVDYSMKKRMMVTTSRGCYGRCTFCSVYHFYNYNVRRGRTVENVVGEIEELVNKYDAKIIAFNDDNFFDPHDRDYKWYYKFADEIEKRNLNIIFNFQCRANDIDYDLFSRLKEVGLHYVFVGFESFIPRTLKLFQKALTVDMNMKALDILKRLDMDYQIGLIVFEPFTTFEEVKETFRIISSIYENYNYASPLWVDRLRVYYGTRMEEILREHNMLEGEFPYFSYTIKDKKVETLCRIITDAIFPFVENVTEKETLLAPQAPALLFLWGISYLKNIAKDITYVPRDVVKSLSIETGKFFLNLIDNVIKKLDESDTISENDMNEIILNFRSKYFEKDEKIKKILIDKAILS